MGIAAEELIQQIDSMTVLELNNLVKALESHYGVSAAAVALARDIAALLVDDDRELAFVIDPPPGIHRKHDRIVGPADGRWRRPS